MDYCSASGLRCLPTNYLSTSKSPTIQPKQADSREGRREKWRYGGGRDCADKRAPEDQINALHQSN